MRYVDEVGRNNRSAWVCSEKISSRLSAEKRKVKIKENLKILRTLAEIQCKQSLIVGKLSREGQNRLMSQGLPKDVSSLFLAGIARA
jgi:hypothetical protein